MFTRKIFVRAPCAVAAIATATVTAQKPFTAADMLNLVRISGSVAVSPKGDAIAYVLPDTRVDENVLARRQVGGVHVQSLAGGKPNPIAWSRTSHPAWSPDGGQLAVFIEDVGGHRIAVWNRKTRRLKVYGEPFSGRPTAPPQWAGSDHVVYAKPVAPAPPPMQPRIQVLRSSDRSLPGDGFFRRTRAMSLSVLDLADVEVRPLATAQQRPSQFATSPRGSRVLYTVSSTRGRGSRRTMLLDLARDDAPRLIGTRERFFWSSDGKRLLFRSDRAIRSFVADEKSPAEGGSSAIVVELGRIPSNMTWAPNESHFVSTRVDPSIVDPEIAPTARGMYSIARPFLDLCLISCANGRSTNLTDSMPDQISSPVWSAEGDALFFRSVDNASYDETIHRYDIATGKLTKLTSGAESYGSLAAVPGGLLVSIQNATTPADLWFVDGATGDRRQITALNPGLDRFRFGTPRLFHFGATGGARLGALLYRPAGLAKDAKVPVITYVYEKLTPGIHRFHARNQIFLTHGYAILMPNVRVKVGETGTSFVRSVVPAVQAVRSMGGTTDKFAIWGGSFGAYAASFVITQTDIFDCAVCRATPPELFRNWASGRDRDSDNIERGQARMGGSPFQVQERYLAQSAFFHLDKVKTPVLLMHGIKDYTILYEEGAMMFYGLRRLGKEAELVLYRDGDHSLSRGSREDTLDVNRRMLAWFKKYLKPGG